MAWQMLVIVGQLSAGAVLVSVGLRVALQHWLAARDPGHRARLEQRRGAPLVHARRSALIGLAAALLGVVLLATIDLTAALLPGRQL